MIDKIHIGSTLLLGSMLLSITGGGTDCDPDPTPTPIPTPTLEPGTPTPNPTPSGTPVPPGGFGLADRVPNTTCLIERFAEEPSALELVPAFEDLSFSQPVFLTNAGDGSDKLYVLEKQGRIRRFNNDDGVQSTSTFLDITDRVSASASEMGLLGMAFHPDYDNGGYIYLNYTTDRPRRTVVSRFTVHPGAAAADANSEVVLVEVNQPYSNHNGGMAAFGHDGYLYVGFGDGGAAGDPQSSGQDPYGLLATMIRLDVDNTSPGKNYAIPEDNPFATGNGGAPEVYAYGLRNPWRFSFDRLSGDLWVADVGQDAWEEVNILELGGNYGWNTMEGTHCYEPAVGCDTTGLEMPVIEYSHSVGRSITGGYVYRGTALPELYGKYIYGDYVNGQVWAATFDGDEVTDIELLVDTSLPISSFGEDEDGEVYVVAYGGTLYRFARADDSPVEGVFPTKLSATGCFTDVANHELAPGVYPYGVNSLLWSDGEMKDRYFAVPGMEQITFTEEGPWEFPDGSILFKDFYTLDDVRDPSSKHMLETRMYVNIEGEWRGYTYKWNDDQTDAFLLNGSLEETFDVINEMGQTEEFYHYYPSREDCQACHTAASTQVLGLHTGQLNGDYPYDRITDNQLRALDNIEIFDIRLEAPFDQYAQFPNPADEDADLALRARSYLQSNCAHCHLPGGTAVASIDLRYETAFADTESCNVTPEQGDMGVEGALLIDPGHPESSVMSLRMHTLDAGRMPPLATYQVDPLGTAVIDAWISELQGCP